jgi:hypothetical protein
MDQERIDEFVNYLRHARVGGTGVSGSALIVRRKDSSTTSEDVLSRLTANHPVVPLKYDNATDEPSLLNSLRAGLAEGEWMFLQVNKDLSAEMIQMLNKVKSSHSLDNQCGQLPRETRLIVFSDQSFVEEELTYRNFYKLFGPVLGV